MKKLLILLLIIPFLSCETNTEKMAGEWYRGAWKGKKFQLADDKYVDLAKKVYGCL